MSAKKPASPAKATKKTTARAPSKTAPSHPTWVEMVRVAYLSLSSVSFLCFVFAASFFALAAENPSSLIPKMLAKASLALRSRSTSLSTLSVCNPL
ncbi:hypothetical protein B0H13DRAFT_2372840 [Mycena leptocephala]|nr:hypothetical protein B0H13DRAFT_2372840 [Mycena leptocephala]